MDENAILPPLFCLIMMRYIVANTYTLVLQLHMASSMLLSLLKLCLQDGASQWRTVQSCELS